MERSTTALLYINGVTVSFDGFRALNNLSLTVQPGEMRAIIGSNGASKTTMMARASMASLREPAAHVLLGPDSE